jgi:hypothetical protein
LKSRWPISSWRPAQLRHRVGQRVVCSSRALDVGHGTSRCSYEGDSAVCPFEEGWCIELSVWAIEVLTAMRFQALIAVTARIRFASSLGANSAAALP